MRQQVSRGALGVKASLCYDSSDFSVLLLSAKHQHGRPEIMNGVFSQGIRAPFLSPQHQVVKTATEDPKKIKD